MKVTSFIKKITMWKTPKQLEKERKAEEKKIKDAESKSLKRKQKKQETYRDTQGAARIGGHLLHYVAGDSTAKGPTNRKVLKKDNSNQKVVPQHQTRQPISSGPVEAHTAALEELLNDSCEDHAAAADVPLTLHTDSIQPATEESSVILNLRRLALQNKIKELQDEALSLGITFDNIKKPKKKKRPKRWGKDRKLVEEKLDEKRGDFFKAFLAQHGRPAKVCCSECAVQLDHVVVCCNDCKEYFCSECDFLFHFKRPFHFRESCLDLEAVPLLPTEFLDATGSTKCTNVPVPVYIPQCCKECGRRGTLERRAGSSPIVVVTMKGRFDLSATSFWCSHCQKTTEEATEELYIESGYLLPKNPLASLRKFIETLEEVSAAHGRCDTINRNHFSMASREYEFMLFRLHVEVLHIIPLRCEACGEYPLSVHIDGNFKLYQWFRENQYQSRSLFKNSIMQWNEDRKAHEDKINAVKPPARDKATCGPSTYAAGVAESNKSKNLRATGILCGSCRHGCTLGLANMEKGESYRAVHFLQSLIPTKFFCQDVVCHYWKFAHHVGELIPEFGHMTEKSEPFLSRWHAKTHGWDCQCLFSGQLKEGAAATLGEETEEAFAYFSLHGMRTKRMDDGTRRDRLSSSAFYRNQQKNSTMDVTLVKRMKTAIKRVPQLENDLRVKLEERKIGQEKLPSIHQALRRRAMDNIDKVVVNKFPLALERQNLEGLQLQIKRLDSRLNKESVHAKERTKLQISKRKVKAKALDVMRVINDYIGQVAEQIAVKNEAHQELSAIEKEVGTWIPVTELNLYDGKFSWQKCGESLFREDFDIVDNWMLAQRFQEETSQTAEEMIQFLDALNLRKKSLQCDFKDLEEQTNLSGTVAAAEHESVLRGKIALIANEITLLQHRIFTATKLFEPYLPEKPEISDDSSSSDSSVDCDSCVDSDDDVYVM